MNLSKLQDKLIAAARKNPPSDRVPYAFEKRIMTRLASVTPQNHWALWGGPLWRAAVSCVAITILCGVWSLSQSQRTEQETFSQAFDAAVLTPPSQYSEGAW